MGRRPTGRGSPLTVRLPAGLLEEVDKLVEKGKYKTRTDVFNAAVKQMLRDLGLWGISRRKVEKADIKDESDAIISVRLDYLVERSLREVVTSGTFRNRSEALKTALLHFLNSPPPPEPEKTEPEWKPRIQGEQLEKWWYWEKKLDEAVKKPRR